MNINGFPPKWGIPQVVGATGMAGVAQLVELWIVIPMPPSDISDLSPKTVWTSVDISSKCRQSVDKMWTNRKERHGNYRRLEFTQRRKLKR